MAAPFVPATFAVPRSKEGTGFRLEPLGPEHNDRDHRAWMSSLRHIRSTPGADKWDDEWPVRMSLEDNLRDLETHAEDFSRRTGFTYSILDGDDVIGCVYIYPSKRPGHDAEVTSWVRASRAEMDVPVWRSISEWIERDWPFSDPYYAERT